MDYASKSLKEHRLLRGKLSVSTKCKIRSRNDLSVYYTPGIAAVSSAIAENNGSEWEYTWRGNTVAIISDGSAVLGLGNIGPAAAQPVMAGKAVLFKEFANIDAIPIVLASQEVESIVSTVRNIAPSFGSINLEDISAPRCFEIEAALQDLGIPVMHDDQHGTAVVVLAGLINAAKVAGKKLEECRIVISGAGAAGSAIARMISSYTENRALILITDRQGILYIGRSDMNPAKEDLCAYTNPHREKGDLKDALLGADIFIGVSHAGLLKPEMIKAMGKNPIIFAMANPVPEIMPEEALGAGAYIVASGRSDYPNQVNNVLAFPGIFRGALDSKATRISYEMLMAAAKALASIIKSPTTRKILPNPLDKAVVPTVAIAVAEVAKSQNITRK